MTTWTRIVAAAVLTAGAVMAADPPEPLVEFDGRAHLNPRGQSGGKMTATGVARPPAGCKMKQVTVSLQEVNAVNKSGWRSATATLDTTKTPVTWAVDIHHLEPGREYWVEARAEYVEPDGTRKADYTLDRRRVYVPPAK